MCWVHEVKVAEWCSGTSTHLSLWGLMVKIWLELPAVTQVWKCVLSSFWSREKERPPGNATGHNTTRLCTQQDFEYTGSNTISLGVSTAQQAYVLLFNRRYLNCQSYIFPVPTNITWGSRYSSSCFFSFQYFDLIKRILGPLLSLPQQCSIFSLIWSTSFSLSRCVPFDSLFWNSVCFFSSHNRYISMSFFLIFFLTTDGTACCVLIFLIFALLLNSWTINQCTYIGFPEFGRSEPQSWRINSCLFTTLTTKTIQTCFSHFPPTENTSEPY